MADPHGKLREIAWGELFPWLILARTVRIALMARVLILGAVGLIAMTLGWLLIGTFFSPSDDLSVVKWKPAVGPKWNADLPPNSFRPAAAANGNGGSSWIWEGSRELSINMSARSAAEIVHSSQTALTEAPVAMWLFLTRPFVQMFSADVTPTGFLYLLLCCVWELFVWGLAGGAITRIAALKFTRDEAPGLVSALGHSAGKIFSYSMPPLIALAFAAVFGLQLLLLGVLMRIPIIAMVAGLLWPFVLMLGLLMAIILIGALLGWPLMWATVSVEGTDAFDALSRSYAYTYQRPWRLLWYVLFAAFLAAVSMFVVKAFAASAVALGDWSVSWGLDDDTTARVVKRSVPQPVTPNLAPPADSPIAGPVLPDLPLPPDVDTTTDQEFSTTLSLARSAIQIWKSLMAALVAGYQAAFLWVAAVGVYLLLRRDIDGVEMNDVYVTDTVEEHGMPPLDEDAATGVPEVSPRGPALPGDVGSAP